MGSDELHAEDAPPLENELARSVTRLEAVLAGMLDPVITIDDHGTVQTANLACAKVFGYRPEELVGENIKVLMPEPFHSEHDGYLAHYRSTGETGILGKTRQFPVVRKDGGRIQVELSVSRIELPDGPPVYCGSFRDVTARVAAEEALAKNEQRFRAIFDQEYQFVGLLDPDGTLLEANRAALGAVGVEREEVVGRPFWEAPWWSHDESAQERLRAAIREAAAGRFVRFETTHPAGGGRMTHVDFSLKPVRDESGAVVLLLPEGRDITDVKRAQERETAMLRGLAAIGESASLLAHEIKNPITAVNAALRAVARELGEDDREVLADLVGRMQGLEKLMRRTLSLAKPLELERATVEPAALLESAVVANAPDLDARGVVSTVAADSSAPPLHLDPGLMEEALTNLLRNAADAVGEGGRVRLGVRLEEARVIFFVEDDGPGVPEHVKDSLFRPFVTTKSGGTGLGLALTRKIAEAHGGTIGVCQGPLGGACFEIALPRPA